MKSTEYRLAYACWRFDMWLKNRGTYEEIDAAVEQGTLLPLVRHEDQERELAKRRGGLFGRMHAWFLRGSSKERLGEP